MKRLIRKADTPVQLIFNSPEEKVDPKDEITHTTYGPSLSKEWLFEKPIDNPEWSLRNSMGQ